jgi:hypothetical protein
MVVNCRVINVLFSQTKNIQYLMPAFVQGIYFSTWSTEPWSGLDDSVTGHVLAKIPRFRHLHPQSKKEIYVTDYLFVKLLLEMRTYTQVTILENTK